MVTQGGSNNGSGAQTGTVGNAPGSVQSGQQQPGNTFNSVGAAAQAGTLGSNSFLQNSAQGQGINEAPPSAAQSAYEYQQYVSGAPVTVGAQLADLLGLPAGATTGDKIMRAFQNLPYDSLVQMEQWLWQAGFYTNVEGVASTTRPTFGTLNIDAFAAMSQAILQASDYKTSLSQLVASGVAAQVGKTQEESQLSPITGGGNAYQVTLPNPDDVYQQAYQVYEQELGRAPTQAEVTALTQSLDKQTELYQQSLNNQQEQVSQQKYQIQLAQRQAQLNPAVAPNVPTQQAGGPPAIATKGNSMVGQKTVGGGNAGSVSPPQPASAYQGQAQAQQQAQTQQQVQQMLQAAKNPAVAKYLASQAAQVDATMHAAQTNPQVAAYLQAQQLAGQPQTQMSAPGDTYIPSNTLTAQQAPSAAGLAFTQATTGPNAVPYLGYQYLQAFQAIANMIKAGGPTG